MEASDAHGDARTGARTDSGADPGTVVDVLERLAALPGVPEAVDGVRAAVDAVYGHRVMRRRAPEVAAEAALRGARASAALAGADWGLEEVRARTDFGAGDEARTVGAALRLTAEAGRSPAVWRGSPLRVLARLHLLAAGGAVARDHDQGGGREPGRDRGGSGDAVGRPRLAGEAVTEPALADLGAPAPAADEVAARLDALNGLLVRGSRAPALVTAAIVHGELLALRPFGSQNGPVARAAERVVLIGAGLDPKGVTPAEVGHAEQGRPAYLAALRGYVSGRPEGVAAWIAHCGRAVELGARESVAVCEAMQRGAS